MKRSIAVIMMLAVLGLTGIGLVMLSSATMPLPDSSSQLQRQMIWFVAGLCAFCVAGWVDYSVWRRIAWPAFILSIFLMILVFVPGIGSRVKGSSRWIGFGGFKVQPSEFLRITLVILLANMLALHQTRIHEFKWGLWWPLGITAVPVVFLGLEPDRGTMLLIVLTTLVLIFVAGARIWPLLLAGGVGGAGFLAMIYRDPVLWKRVLAFLHPEEHKEGAFFQIWQGMLAFGSGGTEGLGLGKSRQKMFYLPESTTDSIFPIIGEELGFYATLAIVLAYVVILVCGLLISLQARDRFGMLLGMGVVFGLSLQALINIGTVTGCIPPKGFPLPFVSYGGSNLVMSYASIGILVSIHRQSLRARRFRADIPIDENTPCV
jgi:cell division protein FtsW